VSRFPGRDHFAAYNGTAPIEVSSGQRKIYRLSRRVNRRLNHAIHMAAVTQIRNRHSAGRAYYDKKLAEGKTRKEALRALKRQVSDAIFARLQADGRRARGPGGQPGNHSASKGGRLTPRTAALRASHSRAWPQPYDCARCPAPCQAFPGRCHTAVGEAAGPGGAPAAKRGRTTWRCGEVTATLGHEEGHRPRAIGEATPHPTHREKDRPNLLTQRGIRSVRVARCGDSTGGSRISGLSVALCLSGLPS
jgi:Transposase IS116/IS110/IS902 family